MDWISVQDRTPEVIEHRGDYISEDVLIYNDSGYYVAAYELYPISEYRDAEKHVWIERSTGCGCCSECLKPTHWMPIPHIKKRKLI